MANSKYDPLRRNVVRLKPGEAFIGTKGEDFTCEPVSFQGVVHKLASEKNGGWKATTTIVGRSVVYAFFRSSDYMKPNLPACPLVKKLKGEA